MQSYSKHRLTGTNIVKVKEKKNSELFSNCISSMNCDCECISCYIRLKSYDTHWVSHFLKLSQLIPPCVLQFASRNSRLLDIVSPGRRIAGLGLFWTHGELADRSVEVQRSCRVHLSPRHSSHLHAQVFRMRQTEQHHSHSHRRPGCGNGGNGKCRKVYYKCVFLMVVHHNSTTFEQKYYAGNLIKWF